MLVSVMTSTQLMAMGAGVVLRSMIDGTVSSAQTLVQAAVDIATPVVVTGSQLVIASVVAYVILGTIVFPAYYYYDSGRHGSSCTRHFVWPILPPFKPIFDNLKSA